MAWKDTSEATRGVFWIAMFVGGGLLLVIAVVLLSQAEIP
jgi:hypothetical protein